jgi:hypothetical protein
MDADPKRFWSCMWYAKDRDIRSETRPFETSIHRTRDGAAHLELAGLLTASGYSYGGTLLNLPENLAKQLGEAGKLRASPPGVRAEDVTVVSTRPPLDDRPGADKRAILRSHTPEECRILAGLRPFFTACDRSDIVLHESVRVPERAEPLRAVKFTTYKGGRVQYLDARKRPREPKAPVAVGYLVAVPAGGPNGSRLVATFSAGGTETLCLAWLWRTTLCDIFRAALTTREKRLWLVTFNAPDAVLAPLLAFDTAALSPVCYACS